MVVAFHNGEGCIVEKGSGYQIWQYVYLFIYLFFLGGGGFVALIVCRDLMGFVFGRISDSGWGGTIFIVLSSLRCGMVLLLKFGMILGVGGFL